MKYVPPTHGINPMHQYVLYKLAGSRTDLLPGIDALLLDKINFKYLDHAGRVT